MQLAFGSAAAHLSAPLAAALDVTPTACRVARFPDGELDVRLTEDVRGADVYLVQPLPAPIHAHLIELLLLADAAARGGADRVTAVVPYLAYARQDRRTAAGAPVGLRVVADAISGSAIDRIAVVDPHTAALEAVFGVTVELTTAVPDLAGAIDVASLPDPVLVAPDLGAVKLAERYAERLDVPVVIVRKSRVSGRDVRTSGVVGEVDGRTAIVVDDMITTGGTIEAAIRAVVAAGATERVVVAATHGLFVGPAAERLSALPIARLLVTDSVAVDAADVPVEVVPLAGHLAETLRRLHDGQPLGELALYR